MIEVERTITITTWPSERPRSYFLSVTNVEKMTNQKIRLAQSSAGDARQAVAEFHAAVAQPDMALVLFFCSSEYDLDVLAEEMNRQGQ